MTDREMIEEMAKITNFTAFDYRQGTIQSKTIYTAMAEALYEQNYRKIPKDAVVLTKDEFWKLSNKFSKKELDEIVEFHKNKVRKETAREILKLTKEKCKELEDKYSHYCKSKKECLEETCRYEGVLAVKRELYELAKQNGVDLEE